MTTWREARKKSPLTEERKREIEVLAQLVTYRNQINMSQIELAKKINMSQSQLSKIETGDNIPQMDTLLKIARGLGLRMTFETEDSEKIVTFS